MSINSNPLQRYRGLVLNAGGWQKLQARIRQLEKEKGYKYTPQKISQQTQLIDNQGLHPVTIRKIWRRQIGAAQSRCREPKELIVNNRDFFSVSSINLSSPTINLSQTQKGKLKKRLSSRLLVANSCFFDSRLLLPLKARSRRKMIE